MKFSSSLKKLRTERGLTQDRLADDLGVSKSTISMYENEVRKPGLDMLRTIANYFSVDMNGLVGEDETKSIFYEVLTTMTIGKRIKAKREENGLTQDELAKILGYKFRSSINKIETNQQDLPLSKIVAIARALNTTPSYLMGWDNKSTNIFAYDNIMPIETHKIPLLGTVDCGEPIFAEQDLESYIEVGANIKADFALRCKGDSMINARIWDGDVVFIRNQPMVNNGEIAAVMIDDEATLKRVYINDGTLTLVAENPTYNPIIVNRNDCKNIKILGKAVSFYSEKVGGSV